MEREIEFINKNSGKRKGVQKKLLIDKSYESDG